MPLAEPIPLPSQSFEGNYFWVVQSKLPPYIMEYLRIPLWLLLSRFVDTPHKDENNGHFQRTSQTHESDTQFLLFIFITSF